MKKLIILTIFILLTSCQTVPRSETGTYVFGSSPNGLTRANTVYGTIEILTADGWVEVQDLYKKPVLKMEVK